jgi:hypothetical protein
LEVAYPRSLRQRAISDLSDVGALADELERQAALLTAVATGGRALKLRVPLIVRRQAQKKMPANVQALRFWRGGLNACGF